MLSDTILDELEKISRKIEQVGNNIEREIRRSQLGSKGGHWGNDDLMVLAAFRYCVGRRTHIVHDCADWLIANWPEFGDSIKALIQKELERLFDQDEEYRSSDSDLRPLGDNCDRLEQEA